MELPKWANAFRLVLLVQPSSAAAERVFSILQRFTAQHSMQKRKFWKAKLVNERAKWVNRKSKIGRFIEHKRKAK